MRLKGCFFLNGFPLTIASNNQPQFRFETFENYLMENGIKHRAVTPLHPAEPIIDETHLHSKTSEMKFVRIYFHIEQRLTVHQESKQPK